MRHRVYLGVCHDPNMTQKDQCLMLIFPKDDERHHVIVRPHFIEADNLGELRTKLIAELDARLGYLPGMASAAAVSLPAGRTSVLKPMNSLTIDTESKANANFIEFE